MLTESFWMYIATALLSFCGVLIGVMYKSKCSEVSVCCGAVQFRRNVDVELRGDEHTHQGPDQERGVGVGINNV